MADKKPDEKPEKANVEIETEQGFGTGLRAQLQRRRDGGTDATADVTTREKEDTPLVRVDLYAAPPSQRFRTSSARCAKSSAPPSSANRSSAPLWPSRSRLTNGG